MEQLQNNLLLLLRMLYGMRVLIEENTLKWLVSLTMGWERGRTRGVDKQLEILKDVLPKILNLDVISNTKHFPNSFSILFELRDISNKIPNKMKELWNVQFSLNKHEDNVSTILQLFTNVYRIATKTPLWKSYLQNQSVRQHFEVRVKFSSPQKSWFEDFNSKLSTQMRLSESGWKVSVSYWTPKQKPTQQMKKNRTTENLLKGKYANVNRRSTVQFILPRILVISTEKDSNMEAPWKFGDNGQQKSIQSSSEFEYLMEDAKLQVFKDNIRHLKRRITTEMEKCVQANLQD